ncbi:alpha-tocopherol transfer protein-like isoform X2 [Nilaparvata lugens]|uniref:alpha-tocopherol transfer protein-like isoform X2 n=1 Tax=Nilaparvata lugens TaxID=108931 RepID=UPI00193DF5C2|nr:alpha-tocopherol transfer protein-like isoform X2 [Nilaparvata lugens]
MELERRRGCRKIRKFEKIRHRKFKKLDEGGDTSSQYSRICTPLRGFDSNGNQVIWMRLNNLNPDQYYFGTSLKAIFMTMDAIQLEQGPVPGYVIVLDGKGYTLSHMLRATITLCKRFIQYSQEGSTFFPKAIHVLNLSSVLEKVVTILKPFMKSDLFSVIKFYKPGKHGELFDHLPASIIPDEYGGTGGVLTEIQEEHVQHLMKYKDWFAAEEQLRIDETKRGDLRSCAESVLCNEEEDIGTSLKRLEID